MFSKEVFVKNKIGLHARPANFFTQKANEYKSLIWIEKGDSRANAKSLLGVLSLGVMGGKVRLVADGDDEEQAVEALCELIGDFSCKPS